MSVVDRVQQCQTTTLIEGIFVYLKKKLLTNYNLLENGMYLKYSINLKNFSIKKN